MASPSLQVDIDYAVFQAALNRATAEGKTIGQIIAELLTQHTELRLALSQPTPFSMGIHWRKSPSNFTVMRINIPSSSGLTTLQIPAEFG